MKYSNLVFIKIVKIESISYFGARSDPCCISAPILCQRQFSRLRPFSNSVGSDTQGWALSHSWGLTLKNKELSVLTYSMSSSFPHFLPPWIHNWTMSNITTIRSFKLREFKGKYCIRLFMKWHYVYCCCIIYVIISKLEFSLEYLNILTLIIHS